MDNIKEIIDTLEEEDKREFRVFVNRQRARKNRKDLELFDLLNTSIEPTRHQLIAKLYGEGNKQAYHALRKRLLRHLMDFLALKRLDNDTTSASSIRGSLSLATYLFEHQSNRLGWKFLKKAEEQGVANEQYELLNSVYNLQIEHADSEHSPELELIIEARNANKKLADEDERANIAFAIIKRRMEQYRIGAEEVDFGKLITNVLQDFKLSGAVQRRPGMAYRIVGIVRSTALAKKDFRSFEPYVIKQFKRIEQGSGFGKTHHLAKLNMLYFIAHVLYRNKKFEQSINWLAQLYENMLEHSRAQYTAFYPKYILLLAANYSFMGENEKAVEILENVHEVERIKLSVEDQLNIQLNLCVYRFQQDEFKAANEAVMQIAHTDKWCAKKMGREWVLKKNLIELIIQYELGNVEIVMNRVRSMNRNYSDLFERPIYSRVGYFLGMVKQMVALPDAVVERDFAEQVRDELVNIPREEEDLQAMGFYSWLKSKMLKQRYYDVLLDVVGR